MGVSQHLDLDKSRHLDIHLDLDKISHLDTKSDLDLDILRSTWTNIRKLNEHYARKLYAETACSCFVQVGNHKVGLGHFSTGSSHTCHSVSSVHSFSPLLYSL